jgi:prephenate dehydratase
MKTIAIQGIKGSFHEEAAIQLFGKQIQIEPCNTFKELAEKVDDRTVETGIIAIENTISGTILHNFELIRQFNLCITHEVYLRIVQNLGAVKGATMKDIHEVHSHYMALNQCRDFFEQHRQIQLIESVDTALSIREVAIEQNIHKAAIGSKTAIEYYGLDLLSESIETVKQNWTRFAIVSKQTTAQPDFNKVSICVELQHKPGSLSQVLSLLFLLGINLTKIESVPILGKPWNYRFYIDFVLSQSVSFESVIESITPHTQQLTILGKYQTGKIIEL